MTRIRSGLRFVVALLAPALLGLQTMKAGAQAESIANPVKIAIVGPFSGRSAEAGERVGSAVRIAV